MILTTSALYGESFWYAFASARREYLILFPMVKEIESVFSWVTDQLSEEIFVLAFNIRGIFNELSDEEIDIAESKGWTVGGA